MTVTTTNRVAIFTGNGVATVFPFNFNIPSSDVLSVSLQNATTKEIILIVPPGAYLATGLDNPTGGSITYPLSGTPLLSDTNIVILRTMPYTQQLDIENQGGFFPDTMEAQLDFIVMQIQQLAEISNRSIVVPIGEDAPSVLQIEQYSDAAQAAAAQAQAYYNQIVALTPGLLPGVSRYAVGAGVQSINTGIIALTGAAVNLFINGVYQFHNTWSVSAGIITPVADTWPGDGIVVNAEVISAASAVIATSVPQPGSVVNSSMADGAVNARTLFADVAVRLMEFDIRDSRFGGLWNDSADDTPALAAFVAYCQTLGGLSQYDGKHGAILHLPRGVGRVSNFDATLATNIHFVGEGDNDTTMRNVNNNPCIFTTNVAGVNDGYRIGFRKFTIYGPGRANVNAHGLKLGSINNGVIEDIRMYACRNALDITNNWQTDITRLKVDGGTIQGSSVSCYNGIYMRDGPGSVQENALKITGGVISGVENWALRGESISGTVIIGMEFLAAGKYAMYLGDNPTGKDVKWFTAVGCLFDTTPDLVKINKGGAAYGGQMHFDGCWFGYASEGGGQGVALELNNIQDSFFGMNTCLNSDIGIQMANCSGVTVDVGTMQTYDRSLVGAVPIQLNNSSANTVRVGGMSKTLGSPSTLVAAEIGTSDFNVFDLPQNDGGVTVLGANTSVRLGTRSVKSKNRGLATVGTGTSSVVVTHGLFRTPVDGEIMISPKFSLASVGVNSIWVDTFTSTQFTIHTNANPSSNLGIAWSADVSRS